MNASHRLVAARVASLGVASSFLAACAGGDRAPSADPVVRDSAGVAIVEITTAPAPTWQVSQEPLWSVGWEPDDPPFTWIQSGRIRPDGGAVFGEYAEGSLFLVGPEGSLEGRWGRKGEGPGEYQGLDALVLAGDSLLVSDGQLRRVTRLGPGGDAVATHDKPGAFMHQVSSVLEDGRVVLIPGSGYSAVAETRPEWVFEEQPILAADLGTGRVDTLAFLPHLLRWYGRRGGPPAPVGVWGRAAGLDDGFVWARSDRPEVRWFDQRGRAIRVVRWSEEPTPLGDAMWDRIFESRAERARARGVEEEVLDRMLADQRERADRFDGAVPFWGSLVVDRSGNAWLCDYPLLEDFSERWRVVTRDGSFVGPITLPGVVTILDATDDRLLVVRFDELEVPAVQMLELIKE